MTKKEIIRNLKYTMEKHKNDRVDTFGTNISLMCKDILDYLEKEPCGKDINVPATDYISREKAKQFLYERLDKLNDDELYDIFSRIIDDMYNELSFVEQEPCDDCISREQAINSLGECPMNWMDSYAEIVAERDWKDTVKMLNSLPSVTPQEPVLDKIRAEIDTQEKWLSEAGYTVYNVDIAFSSIKRVIAESRDK